MRSADFFKAAAWALCIATIATFGAHVTHKALTGAIIVYLDSK